MADIKNCPGYNLLIETRKWVGELEKEIKEMKNDRIAADKNLREDLKDMRDEDYSLKEILTRLDLTLQGQEKVLQGLVDKTTGLDKELHNGLIAKKAEEWFYKSIGKWVVASLVGNGLAILTMVFTHFHL